MGMDGRHREPTVVRRKQGGSLGERAHRVNPGMPRGAALAPALTPHGRLLLAPADDAPPLARDVAERLREAFDRGAGHGLLQLGAGEVATALPAGLRLLARARRRASSPRSARSRTPTGGAASRSRRRRARSSRRSPPPRRR